MSRGAGHRVPPGGSRPWPAPIPSDGTAAQGSSPVPRRTSGSRCRAADSAACRTAARSSASSFAEEKARRKRRGQEVRTWIARPTAARQRLCRRAKFAEEAATGLVAEIGAGAAPDSHQKVRTRRGSPSRGRMGPGRAACTSPDHSCRGRRNRSRTGGTTSHRPRWGPRLPQAPGTARRRRRGPSTVFHATRWSGRCSTISASNSRVTPAILRPGSVTRRAARNLHPLQRMSAVGPAGPTATGITSPTAKTPRARTADT